MADLELLYFEQLPETGAPCPDGRRLPSGEDVRGGAGRRGVGGGGGGGGGGGEGASAPRTETAAPETETCFRGTDEEEDVRLIAGSGLSLSSSSELCEEEEEEDEEVEEEEAWEEQEDIPELYLLSEEELSSESPGRSVDYGFILAVSCLVTGISLVAISYSVPREARVDPDSVSAREMERLERERARVGAHLDRCVMAGLSLLTLGGVLLSTLLTVSMWKGEMMRRRAFAFSKRAASRYGSISLRGGSGSSPTRGSSAAPDDGEALS